MFAYIMHTFPGNSENYLLNEQSIGQVYDLYLHAIEINTQSIRESDYLALGLGDNEIEITDEELNQSLKALNSLP